MARHIDADRLLSFIQHDLEIISPCEHTADDIVMMIQTAPPADVELVRHGRWKKRKNWDKYVCSECSSEEDMARHYCPNCGAKMDREDENAPAD